MSILKKNIVTVNTLSLNLSINVTSLHIQFLKNKIKRNGKVKVTAEGQGGAFYATFSLIHPSSFV